MMIVAPTESNNHFFANAKTASRARSCSSTSGMALRAYDQNLPAMIAEQ